MAIPILYRLAFGVFDIAMPAMGIYANLLDPGFVLGGFTTKFISPLNNETRVLLDAGAGWFAALILLNIAFLRYKANDITVWKILETAMILVDVFQLLGFARLYAAEGKTEVASLSGQDLGNVIGYSVIAAVRAAFVLGIGLSSAKAKTKKRQ